MTNYKMEFREADGGWHGPRVYRALVTGVVVANRPGHESAPRAESPANGHEADATCMWSRGSLSSPCAAAAQP